MSAGSIQLSVSPLYPTYLFIYKNRAVYNMEDGVQCSFVSLHPLSGVSWIF